jgi:hypothetical protein
VQSFLTIREGMKNNTNSNKNFSRFTSFLLVNVLSARLKKFGEFIAIFFRNTVELVSFPSSNNVNAPTVSCLRHFSSKSISAKFYSTHAEHL